MTEELKALIAAHAAEIAALKVENEKLGQRVMHLEEQLRLERLHRYAGSPLPCWAPTNWKSCSRTSTKSAKLSMPSKLAAM
jgi:hypothetical protein